MLIKGKDLTKKQLAQVKAAFVYRSLDTTRTEEQWIADHAFHFVKDGSRLSFNRRFAEPVYMADDEVYL